MNAIKTASSRVVFVSGSAGVWGAEESLLTLAKALKESGRDVALVCFSGPLSDRWATELSSEPVVAGHRDAPDSTKLATALTLWKKYLSTAVRGDSVVLFTYYLVTLAPFARILLLRKNVTLVLDMHDNLPGKRGRALLQLFSTFVHRVIAVSSFTAGQFGVHAKKVSVINRPVEPTCTTAENSLDSSDESERPVRIGIVGRLVRGKGHDLLLAAAGLLNDDSEIVVRGAGDGSTDDVADVVVANGTSALGRRFIFDGVVARERVMDGLDILVVANDREPLGRTVIEAQLNGVVAVVPDAGGSSELVHHGVTGCKYASGDATSLSEVLRLLVGDKGLRKELVTAARSAAKISSSPKSYARTYSEAMRPKSIG
ncbi:glycosyltransferase family 4 protein [Arthrobacter humicola]